MVQYMQTSNQAWSHMFHDCAQALYVDTSGWPGMPLFQPPLPPQPVPPPPLPSIDTDATLQAQREEKEAFAADDPLGDL